MAHELEQLADGRTAFVAAREPGWHRLGYVRPDGLFTMEDIMAPDRGALGGWNVRKSIGIMAAVPSGRAWTAIGPLVPSTLRSARCRPNRTGGAPISW